MSETTLAVRRRIEPADASSLVGTLVGQDLTPTFRSPAEGDRVRLVDEETGATVALVTRLNPVLRSGLRNMVTTMKFGAGVGRHSMSGRGAVFGYLPPKPMARQEGCRMSTLGRDHPGAESLLEDVADSLAAEFDQLLPEQAQHDKATVADSLLRDWRLSESSWSSGVINQMNVLPYHRDGNNLETWSAMPTLRYGMSGGYLHVPEFDIVFPCGDGDVTWFYGRGLVHGVTPIAKRTARGYRYSLVFYALKGLVNCATYAEETRAVAARRTARERDLAKRLRAELADAAPQAAGEAVE